MCGMALEKNLAQSCLERCPHVGNYVSLVPWLTSGLALGWSFNTAQLVAVDSRASNMNSTTARTSNGKGCHPLHLKVGSQSGCTTPGHTLADIVKGETDTSSVCGTQLARNKVWFR